MDKLKLKTEEIIEELREWLSSLPERAERLSDGLKALPEKAAGLWNALKALPGKALKAIKESGFYREYSLLGILCAVCVLMKVLLFYSLMGVKNSYVEVSAFTLFLIFLLFSAFKNKWIPAVLYAVLSALFFADATYHSYFGKYLSVVMIGAAGVLGDIGQSIKEVISPKELFLFADAVLILCCLGIRRYERGKADRAYESALESGRAESLRNYNEESLFSPRRYRPLGIAALAIALVVGNPTGGSIATSVSNQEIVSFHVKDILENSIEKGEDLGSLGAFKGNYKDEIDGPLFGVAEGRNLIVVQLESFQNFAIGLEYMGQEVTPVLNSLIASDSLYFDHYYFQVGSGNTSDAEFATNNSINGSLLSYTYKIYQDNYFRGLPVLLSEEGYDTAVFHAYDDRTFWNRKGMYPAQGWGYYYGGFREGENGGDFEYGDWIGWGLADHDFFRQSAGFMAKMKEPFYGFLISLSNHHPFDMPERFRYIKLAEEDEGTIVGNYLEGAAYTDRAVGELIDALKEEGIYENSVICFYGDHMGLTKSEEVDPEMEKLLGHPYDYDTMMNIPLIIHMPGLGITETVHTAGGQMDFMPTIAYLLGLEDLDTIYLGNNILGVDEGFVPIQTYMAQGSFFTDSIMFEMSRDGVYANSRAKNIYTGEEYEDIEQFRPLFEESVRRMTSSDYILRSDALRAIYEEGMSAKDAGVQTVHKEPPDRVYTAGYPDRSRMGDNSVSALEYSYYNSNYQAKSFYIDVYEAEDGSPVMLGKDGKVSMTLRGLQKWMEKHGDISIVAHIHKENNEELGEEFISALGSLNYLLPGRTFLELESFAEYSGKRDAIVDLSAVAANPEEAGIAPVLLLTKKPWALSVHDDFSEYLIPGTADYSILFRYNPERQCLNLYKNGKEANTAGYPGAAESFEGERDEAESEGDEE